MNTFFLRLEIAKNFHETKIYPVPGDVHCLIYSWKIALMDPAKLGFEPSYDVLRNLINMEFQRNINEYTTSLLAEVYTKRYKSIWMKRATYMKSAISSLTHYVPVLFSYRKQSIDLQSKSIDRFVYEGNTSI